MDFKTGYGLTEAGPNNFWLPPGEVRRKPGAVGVPLFHVEVRLEGGGDVGELLLRGPHVCAGYWRRPEETAKALAGGWLHTGDLAERDAEGCYRIVGRVKDLIISGGENIYPAEVEGVLAGHPEVAEVAVIGVPDPKWGEVPRALVVPRPDTVLTAEALLSYCQGRLARYKTPKTVRFVEALPRTAAGKVDRRELAARHGARPEGGAPVARNPHPRPLPEGERVWEVPALTSRSARPVLELLGLRVQIHHRLGDLLHARHRLHRVDGERLDALGDVLSRRALTGALGHGHARPPWYKSRALP